MSGTSSSEPTYQKGQRVAFVIDSLDGPTLHTGTIHTVWPATPPLWTEPRYFLRGDDGGEYQAAQWQLDGAAKLAAAEE